MGSCCSVTSVEEAESAQQFRQVDTNKNSLIDHKEMENYVKSHAEMWAMLSVNLGLSEEVCQKTATRVAMELASGLHGKEATQAELTEAQFHAFRSKYMLDGKGAQEFFHRCVFTSFAKDGNNYLDANKELDAFLDTFYKSGSIFEGDTRLPPKEELKARILTNNTTGKLSFEQLRDIIRGTTGNTHSAPANANMNTPRPSTVSMTSTRHSSGVLDVSNPESHQSPPEETPEPKQLQDLAPPSIELSLRDNTNPEKTPEVQPLPPPSPPKQQKPRQRRSTKGSSNGDRAASRSRSPSKRRKSRTSDRSKSPSQRKPRTTNRSKSPSQRKVRTTSRSRSPSQRKIRSKTNTPEGSPTQQQQDKKPRRARKPSGAAPAEKKRATTASQPQKPKAKRQ